MQLAEDVRDEPADLLGNLCKPCAAHSDCDDEPDLCITVGNGKYCGEDCADDGVCPDGYVCQDVDVPSGGETLKAKQCVPESGRCLPCRDEDGDGALTPGYGGADCDDVDSSVHPGADETWYDGVDSDCAGDDDFDADADGHASDAYGGDDCDDQDGEIHPGADDNASGVATVLEIALAARDKASGGDADGAHKAQASHGKKKKPQQRIILMLLLLPER